MENPPEETPARWKRLPSWLLTQTAHHAHRLVTDGFSAAHARGYHYRLLATLDEFGPASQAALSRRSGIHVSDMVAAINELADRQLVERAPDPSDRRRNIISLTAAGRRQLRRLEKQLAESQDELLAPLSPEERERLTELLSRLLDHHDRRTGAAEGPGAEPGPPAVHTVSGLR
ncbi:MarR family transcriptional regulator [Streptomyces sp. 8K308]|uniref:MarR family winged helix-turn-helix transcriptional regulator n=1 Tax=Streptomyces sp. 8K308 TaxID=2530388 RepID=UPI00105251E5|nr:MarR family transcriptional regulator [Streptomyces sp. 8K308]TDC05815.1 MarR family transcriptional regulator [Streptomyces sp. 8K308]